MVASGSWAQWGPSTGTRWVFFSLIFDFTTYYLECVSAYPWPWPFPTSSHSMSHLRMMPGSLLVPNSCVSSAMLQNELSRTRFDCAVSLAGYFHRFLFLFVFFVLISNPKLLSQKTLETLQLNTFSFIFYYLLPPTLEHCDVQSSSPHTNLLPFPSNTFLHSIYVPLLNVTWVIFFFFELWGNKEWVLSLLIFIMLLWGGETTIFHGRRPRLGRMKWFVQSCPASQHQVWCSNPNQSNSNSYTLSHEAKLLFRSLYFCALPRIPSLVPLSLRSSIWQTSPSTFEVQFKHQRGQSLPVHH